MSNPAETYETYFVPAQFSPIAQRLVDAANPRPGERILDVACGTGIVLRKAAPYVGPNGTLTGVDMNANMLAVARHVAAQEGLSVDVYEATADDLPFGDASFDLVLCSQGLQFFPGKVAALGEMKRVLTKDGRVVISVWRDPSYHPLEQALFDVIEDQLGISGAAAPFSLGDEHEIRRLLAEAGFTSVSLEEVSITAEFPDPEQFLLHTVHAASAAIPAMQQLGQSERQRVLETVMREIEPHVTEHIVGDRVHKPMHAHIAHARRA